jgi:hypothetical protein
MPLSQIDTGVLSNFLTPRGYEQLDISSGVASLTPPDVSNVIPLLVLIQGDDGDVRWRDDGRNPTAISGEIIFGSATLQYNVLDLTKFRCTSSNVNGASKVNVTYYSYAPESEIPNPVNPFCPVLSLSDAGSSNATCVVTGGNQLTATNIAGGAAFCFFTDTGNTFTGFAGDIIVQEYTIPAPSTFNNPSVFAGLLDGFPPSWFCGVQIQINTNSGDVVIDTPDATVIASGLTLTFPYTFHIEMEISTGDVYFTDGVNTGSGGNGVGSGVGLTIQQGQQVIPPTGAGDNVGVIVNAGSSAFTYPLIFPTAKTWCQV